jgi:hypothetical protein
LFTILPVLKAAGTSNEVYARVVRVVTFLPCLRLLLPAGARQVLQIAGQ